MPEVDLKSLRILPDPNDPPDIIHKLGYDDLVLSRRARQWLEAAHPEWQPNLLNQQVRFAVQAFWNSRPSYSEISRAIVARGKAEERTRFEAGESERGLILSREEILRLVEHFAGANDPVAQSIAEKAQAALN